MRRILVTGANKGIGFAIAERILEEAEDNFVFLGSRDRGRGDAAAQALREAGTGRDNRVHSVEIDVASDDSVERSADLVKEACEGEKLYGIVNNAGIGDSSNDLQSVLNVNVRGIYRVCNAFIPLLSEGGRIVNVTSAAGPNFVSKCSAEWQGFFTRRDIAWSEIAEMMKTCISAGRGSAELSSLGLGDGSPYGLSKALANSLTLYLARQYPQFLINAFTPGFIATDMTRQYRAGSGKTPQELGMKSPREGAGSAIFLLFGEPQGSGHYYGSDAKRSPLDRYRAPGAPAYTGD